MKLNRTLALLLAATASVAAGAAVAAAATTSGTSATAAATAPAPGGRHWHHRHGGMLVGVMLRATRQLNLTSDQQASIRTILDNARTQRKAAAGTAQVDLAALANPGDPNYATALESAKSAAANRFQSEVD